jgi:hypothetical protein
MKNYLKDQKVLVGLAIVVAGVGYYMYDQKRKAKIKEEADKMASTPPEHTLKPPPATPKHGAGYKPVVVTPTSSGKSNIEKVTID